jgi:hypothetical protein
MHQKNLHITPKNNNAVTKKPTNDIELLEDMPNSLRDKLEYNRDFELFFNENPDSNDKSIDFFSKKNSFQDNFLNSST